MSRQFLWQKRSFFLSFYAHKQRQELWQTRQINGSPTRLVIRNRTGSAWKRERVALVRANSLEGDTGDRGLLECTIRITKRVGEPIILTNNIYMVVLLMVTPPVGGHAGRWT